MDYRNLGNYTGALTVAAAALPLVLAVLALFARKLQRRQVRH